MTDREKFEIITQRIKEKAPDYLTFGGEEYTLLDGGFMLTYRDLQHDRYIWFLKETVVLDGEYIDSWSLYFRPDDFDFEEFSSVASMFDYLFEDLEEDEDD